MIRDKTLEILCQCNNEVDEFKWSVREFLSRKVSTIIWGQNYQFNSENDNTLKTFNKFAKLNKLKEILPYVERKCSMYGRTIITINKTKTGDVLLNVVDTNLTGQIAKMLVQPQLAVIYEKFTVDQNSFIIKSTYDTEKVVRQVFGKDEKVLIMGEEARVLEQLQIEKVWYHNFGFVPVCEIQNIAYFQHWIEPIQFARLSDWYPGAFLEDTLYKTLEDLKRELKYCHSRIIVENADQNTINKYKNAMNESSDNFNFIFETGGGSDFSVQPGNGDFTKYTKTYNDLMDIYFKYCGLSQFSEGGGAQKTVAETATIKSSMIESVNQKIVLRQEQYTDLIKKVLAIYGCVNYDDEKDGFTFKIPGNISKDDASTVENIINKISANLMSPQEGIQELRNLSQKEAEEIFEKIYNENKKYGVNIDFISDGEDGNFDRATGTHKDPIKQGAI